LTGPGTCTITANQAGDANYNPAAPATQSFTVTANTVTAPNSRVSAHAGAVIPVIIELVSANGQDISSASITLRAVGVDSGPVLSPGNSQPNNLFKFATNPPSYHFNVDTTGLSPGTHTFNFTIGSDPTLHSISFQLT
jgi:hypothetical protein